MNYVKNIYDITVAYADSIVQSELELVFNGACPKNVHFIVNEYNVDTLPEKDDLVAKWLNEIWEVKEAKLRKFYASNDVFGRKFDQDPGAERFHVCFKNSFMECFDGFNSILKTLK